MVSYSFNPFISINETDKYRSHNIVWKHCDCPEGQGICSYSSWFEINIIPIRYNAIKEF